MSNNSLKNILKRIKLNESTISMILGGLVVIVIGVLVVNYFRAVDISPEITIEEEENGEIEYVQEGDKLVPEALPTSYQVKSGESLWTIAEAHYGSGYNWVDIAQANDLSNPDKLAVGQELTIPKTAVIQPPDLSTAFGPSITGSNYTVEKGDHLWGIAVRAYGDGYQWVKIAQANNLDNPNVIVENTALTIPR